MVFTVYAIKNTKGQIYKGVTSDLEKRITYHNSNLSRWTKNKGPWKLVYQEEHKNKTDALKREKFLKTGKGRELIQNSAKLS